MLEWEGAAILLSGEHTLPALPACPSRQLAEMQDSTLQSTLLELPAGCRQLQAGSL
jgi:hypothetical protein